MKFREMVCLIGYLVLSTGYLVLVACGGGGGEVTPPANAQGVVNFDIVVERDLMSNRVVIFGVSSDPGGIPPATDAVIARPAGWSLVNYCLDTFQVSGKQPAGSGNASLLVVAKQIGERPPSVSVRIDTGIVHLNRVCYADFPVIHLINNWSQNQVMAFTLAGEVR